MGSSSLIGQLVSLFKLRIGIIMALTAVIAMVATPGPAPGSVEVAVLALAVLTAAAGAGAFNQYYESDLDARMRRTCNRPFVTGALTKGPIWLWLIGGMLFASSALAAYVLNAAAALYIVLGALFYAVVYTVWLKRRSWWNVVIGGASGSFAVLAGAASVDPALGPIPLALALVLLLWTPSHFWSLAIARREEYAAAGVPMLPVVIGNQAASRAVLANTLMLVSASLLPAFCGLGWIYLLGALCGGGNFIFRNLQMVCAPVPRNAMRSFHASLVQLSVLLLAAMLDVVLLG
jgi:protoheme IX farnesyltransferase